MLWSSFTDTGYAIGLAAAAVGGALGLADAWLHITEPLYLGDGGHGMVFRTADGVLHLAMHRPNKTPMERAVFIDLTEPIPGLLRIANPDEPF
jgi:hypothetical protein